MQYFTIPGDPDAIMWQNADGSGVIRPSDEEMWTDYQAWLAAGNVPPPVDGQPTMPTLDEARAQANDRLNASADAALAPILAKYPNTEVATWYEQLAEAHAWLQDESTPTLLLDAIAGGDDKRELAETIVAKAIELKPLQGALINWRRAVSAWIAQTEDVEALMRFAPHYPELPT